jgi:methionine synthase I (cobalamin-dependent)
VIAANEHRYDTDILDVLAQRVVVGDGAMGTQLQAADLTLDDFRNRRRRGRDEIRSAANWLTLVTITSPTGSASCRSRR